MLFLRPGHSLFFPDLLSAHFNSMDRYRSIAHFADFQVRSSLNRSKKTSSSLLEKSAKMLDRSWNYSGSLFLKFARARPLPPPPSVNHTYMHSVKEMLPGGEGDGGACANFY